MAGAKTFDLNSVSFAVGGVIIDGFQAGDACTAQSNSDAFSMESGADGEVLFTKSNDRTGTIELTLMYSSEANRTLSELHQLDLQSNAGLTSITITDTRGGCEVFAKNCRISKLPDLTLGQEAGTLTWPLHCADLSVKYFGLPDETP